MINNTRRKLLQFFGLGGAGAAVYSYFKGLRFPPPMFNIPEVDKSRKYDDRVVTVKDAIFLAFEYDDIELRAYAPEPEVSVSAESDKKFRITINNIHPEGTLSITDGKVLEESVNGITREVTCEVNRDVTAHLKWKFPEFDSYDFASIGDTGGGLELDWCIQRAHELGAKFFLHLGDFYYEEGEYERAINAFYNAPLPCYVSIGNHDFHDNGSLYQRFQDEIGAMNNQFSIDGIRYVNLDTAAGFFPANSGTRGELMEKVIAEKDLYRDTVLFTHKPLTDPMEGKDHDVGGFGEVEWLTESLTAANIDTLICGHIHIQAEVKHEGILNIIAGQGLGHQDLLVHKPISQMLMGRVSKGEQVAYRWEGLNMPEMIHCNVRNLETLEDSGQHELKEQMEQACKSHKASGKI